MTIEQVKIVNESGLDDAVVMGSLESVQREVSRWIDNQRAAQQRLSLFDRSGFIAPDNPFGQMEIARRAVENDDIVGGVADVTEALAFQGIKWESENPDDADVLNQIARDLNLDRVVRTWWRETFTYSQAIVALWWGQKQYKVRGNAPPKMPPMEQVTDPTTGMTTFSEPRDPVTGRPLKPEKGPKRKKTYDIQAPVGLTFLDPMKVVPIGTGMWGIDRLAWSATRTEMDGFYRWLNGEIFDPIMARLFISHYEPGYDERNALSSMGVDPDRLLELNPDVVTRHTVTMPDYRRFPDIRLKAVFPHLDLKTQLIEADRVMLVGAANYILLIKKGTDKDPAQQAELSNLRENFKVVAKLPVIISDHRLEVQIITPAQDNVLLPTKFDTLDKRILNRTLGSLTVSSSGQRNESTLTVARGVARKLESARLMIKRDLERMIARELGARNPGQFEEEPNLAFTPRNVQLDSDAQIVQAVLSLRTQKELSRESILEYFGFDQSVEAQRREFEEESGLDQIFGTSIPFNSPSNGFPFGGIGEPPTGAGGRPPGGGQSPQSPQGKVKPQTPNGNPTVNSQ